jgi:carbon-monoxide dehydrogenase medium subunit
MAGGKVATCKIGLTNLSETPLLAEDACEGGDRHQPRSGHAEEGCRCGGSDHVAGRGCPRPVEYRKHVGGIMVTRALQRAAGRAG